MKRGSWSFVQALFKSLKSMHILIFPFFFLATTIFEHQEECLVCAIIPASNIFCNSCWTKGANLGLICLKFCLKGLVSSLRGITC